MPSPTQISTRLEVHNLKWIFFLKMRQKAVGKGIHPPKALKAAGGVFAYLFFDFHYLVYLSGHGKPFMQYQRI